MNVFAPWYKSSEFRGFFWRRGWDGGLNMLTRAEFFSYADIRMNANIRETSFHFKFFLSGPLGSGWGGGVGKTCILAILS